ncbi:MAG: glutamate synthase large subunit, partial [Alphaproteobacteria bacterium]|nr:glutamate synthase large subunit [Alphaproteobacteria bacterium]
SDREASSEKIAMPALLATASVHHHLIKQGLRTSTGLVIETGEAREVHHFCVLAGYGAEAINPWLAFDTLEDIRLKEEIEQTPSEVQKNYIKAVNKGMLKVMSKMGISTYQSYCGAQIFDSIGLSSDFIDSYFTGTPSTIEGAGIDAIAIDAMARHNNAWGNNPIYQNMLDVGGDLAFRLRGEDHAWTPETVTDLQHAVRGNLPDNYRRFANSINDQSKRLLTIRGLMEFKFSNNAITIEDVEPASEIVKRFATGAMSFGSISREAHTNLAIAMNRIGGKSNTGEGGEEVDRFQTLPNGDSMRSAIKQVASGRFGVTTEYLVNADDIQIKMAQGAKPGEGGQLPGHKVNKNIAAVSHSTPGVGLISPPPHHDIYSIEDLAQLIHDLKNVNPKARVSVKLVSEVGVGTVAAGVSKARADHVTISGFEGGTGASPLTSLTHAGSPWEIGLAETQQTLVLNGLRGRIAVQVDGGLRTGRDVVIGALLGADEFGFSTAPLIASGCIMMRKCHLNTCPVGVATQDPILRKRFTGTPEHVINYFFFVAEEVRELMAQLGFRNFDEMIGKSDMLDMRKSIEQWKAQGIDFARLLYQAPAKPGVAIYNCETQNHNLEEALDNELIMLSAEALEKGLPVNIEKDIQNTNRTVGATLSGEVAKKYGHAGLPENTISIRFSGNAGGSFGAFLARGISLELFGDANDYVGKGLSGGQLIVRQPSSGKLVASENIIIGNTVLYGAIAGEAHFEGIAGERFAVRNSGAITVVEGVGDHGCEYMTGGVVVVLGETGRNFAAGMSGGIAYVYDPNNTFKENCNISMVELESIVPTDHDILDGTKPPQALSISAEDSGMGHMLNYDAERLRILIERHQRLTNSVKATNLLNDWEITLTKFIKVMPKDYRRALLELQIEESATVAAAE